MKTEDNFDGMNNHMKDNWSDVLIDLEGVIYVRILINHVFVFLASENQILKTAFHLVKRALKLIRIRHKSTQFWSEMLAFISQML